MMEDIEIEISIICEIDEVINFICTDGSRAIGYGCIITLNVDSISGNDYLFTNRNNFYIHTLPESFTDIERERHHEYSIPYSDIFEDSYEDYVHRIEKEIEYEKR